MNTNISTKDFTKRPNGQPEGYDYYIPFDLEESRILEKQDYIIKMDVVTLATIIAGQGHSVGSFDTYYKRLLDHEEDYDAHKGVISATIVMPFIDSIHGKDSNVSVRWTHSFKTPYIAIKYIYGIPDHSVEKDFLYGTFTAAEIGIDDATIAELADMAVKTMANNDIFEYVMRNYPEPDENQLRRIDDFIDKKNRELTEYEDLKAAVTETVNAFLGARGVDITKQSLQWNMDFASKKVTITKTNMTA